MRRREPMTAADIIRGGCPCGFWAVRNCRYVQAVGYCRTPMAKRPVGPAATPKETQQ